MNCNSEYQLSEVKQEKNPDYEIKVKPEPEDIKTETEECDIKDEIHSPFESIHIKSEDIKTEECDIKGEIHPAYEAIDIRSEVKEMQIMNQCMEYYGQKSQVKHLNTEEDENVNYDHVICYNKDLTKEKCFVHTPETMEVKSDTCTQNDYLCSVNNTQKDIRHEVSRYSLTNINNVNRNGVSDQMPFTCNLCRISFSERHHLTAHLCTNANEKPFNLKNSSSTSLQKSNLYGHDLSHTSEIPFNCGICFSPDRATDVFAQTNEKPIKCSTCSKLFSCKHHLAVHIRSHTTEKLFNCSICSKSFSQEYSLSEHIRTHTNEKPFKCSICLKSYSQKYSLSEHMRIHTNLKPYKCNICSKSFSRKFSLTLHTRTHTNEKPFKCTTCSKPFARKHHLAAHTRVHTTEKLFHST